MRSDERGPVGRVHRAFEVADGYADPALFITQRSRDAAVAAAAGVEAGGPVGRPLYGMVVAVKDNIDVAGLPTTAACPAFSHVPERSAAVVDKLEAAGAIVLGKTNLDQFATGLVGVRSPYGVPRNALRPDLIPGGSSSGSAVAVAAGIVDVALGTDTAGSGRIPAGMNGIVGLKPTLGLLSSTGMVPACRTLDTISIFARDVPTAMKVLQVAAGYDAADAYSRMFPPPVLGAVPPGFRVGVPPPEQRRFFGDDAAAAAYATDLARLAAIGATLVEVDFEPFHAVARLLYEGPWVAERYAATKALIESRPEAFHPITLGIIGGARQLTAVAAFEAMYRLAELRRATLPAIESVDCLAVPTVPRFYTVAEVEADPIALNSNLGTYTNFVNLLDLCALSLPVGRRSDGLPSSLTLIAPAGRDGAIAAIGAKLMGAETLGPTDAAEGRIEVAVVGAHLSGLPLNRDLTALGGTFVRAAATAPDYRLFALNGTTPPKPGLLRVGANEGGSIKAEIWSLDAAGFGRFVAGIPAPLGIGTIGFADGTMAKGFLVEGEAVREARDITSFGGWKAFLADAQRP